MATTIAYVIDTVSCDTAGTQKQLLEIIRRLDPAVYRPVLICLWESEWMRHNELPCPVQVLGYRGLIKGNLPAVVGRLVRTLRAEQARVVQVFFWDALMVCFLAALRLRREVAFVSSRRDIGLGNEPWYHGAYRWLMPLVNRAFRGILANCEAVKDHVARVERVDPTKIDVIPNGLDAAEFGAAAAPVIERQSGEVWIGLVASLTPVKRIDLFLEAFARVGQQGLRAVILGSGPEKARLLLRRSELGLNHTVRFVDAVQDVRPYLEQIDMGLLCSDREGLSNAILEYLAAGLPVIATDVGGNGELVDEQVGRLVPRGDVDALAGAIGELAGDSFTRVALGRAAAARARESFSWQTTMEQYQEYYRRMLVTV